MNCFVPEPIPRRLNHRCRVHYEVALLADVILEESLFLIARRKVKEE
jgi:hypothetical protein